MYPNLVAVQNNSGPGEVTMTLGMKLEAYDLSHVHLASMAEGTKPKHRRKTDKMIKRCLQQFHKFLHCNFRCKFARVIQPPIKGTGNTFFLNSNVN